MSSGTMRFFWSRRTPSTASSVGSVGRTNASAYNTATSASLSRASRTGGGNSLRTSTLRAYLLRQLSQQRRTPQGDIIRAFLTNQLTRLQPPRRSSPRRRGKKM